MGRLCDRAGENPGGGAPAVPALPYTCREVGRCWKFGILKD